MRERFIIQGKNWSQLPKKKKKLGRHAEGAGGGQMNGADKSKTVSWIQCGDRDF